MRSSSIVIGEEINTEGEILVDDINFDDIFVGFDDGGDILPDLEIDPDDIFADFSFCSGEESSGNSLAVVDSAAGGTGLVPLLVPEDSNNKEDYYRELSQSQSQNEVVSGRSKEEEEEEEEDGGSGLENRSAGAGRKLSTTKGSHGKKKKKKAKVDWTPELHRRFVEAVEQLGVDKAVPSRILELMGIDCLTRHNIASHLQKYRSHRKHLLAREAEAASWSQRRQLYAAGSVVMKSRPVADMTKKPSWQAPPIVSFPPPHQMHMRPLIRPLHVWGHPTAAADLPQLVPVWPRHLSTPQPWFPSRPTVVGPPPPTPHDPASIWHSHCQLQALTQGMPCFPPQLVPTMRFQAHPVPGIHPHPLFRPSPLSNNAAAAATVCPSEPSAAPFDTHPSNEKIDAAIGDVLAKPWSPLPLGLKPPSLESVMVELQRQGVGEVPP